MAVGHFNGKGTQRKGVFVFVMIFCHRIVVLLLILFIIIYIQFL